MRKGISRRLLRTFQIVALALFPTVCLAQTTEPLETIRVESDLVDLKVSVISLKADVPPLQLEQKDFRVLEDGTPQDISFFAAADSPFDLILLLDLSGSIADKMKLVRRSAKRFVEATRPTDRVAIVTFTDVLEVISGFTLDREKLKKTLDRMEKPVGGTKFWDSLLYVTESLVPLGQASRRTAIVVMTDGVDNALPDIYGEGSSTSFPELIRIVSDSEAIVLPIYLDTEKQEIKRHRTPPAAYALAREQLAELAEACGTTLYRAAKIEDLENVYHRVIKDLGTVYSIGYRPSNRIRDGKWRSVVVQLSDHTDLVARSKRGYFAKQVSQ
ncbi:MAG TPA: VWA domain-containing protein [Pyrinomonadaceae bacterium]|nr:VWA domain-containing protein [Pyrinomonadaceae bacterium]